LTNRLKIFSDLTKDGDHFEEEPNVISLNLKEDNLKSDTEGVSAGSTDESLSHEGLVGIEDDHPIDLCLWSLSDELEKDE